MKLITNTSPSSLRCLTKLGTNQLKSNLASAPANAARLVINTSSPVHCWANSAMLMMVGRARPGVGASLGEWGACGSCSSTRWPSVCARITVRTWASGPRSCASAGKVTRASRCGVLTLRLAFRPNCWAARSKSCTLTTDEAVNPS